MLWLVEPYYAGAKVYAITTRITFVPFGVLLWHDKWLMNGKNIRDALMPWRLKTQRKEMLWVPWAVSLWHKRAGVSNIMTLHVNPWHRVLYSDRFVSDSSCWWVLSSSSALQSSGPSSLSLLSRERRPPPSKAIWNFLSQQTPLTGDLGFFQIFSGQSNLGPELRWVNNDWREKVWLFRYNEHCKLRISPGLFPRDQSYQK